MLLDAPKAAHARINEKIEHAGLQKADLEIDLAKLCIANGIRYTEEDMFRSQKRYMGLKSFMVRAAKAFDRLLTILCVEHFFFTCGLGGDLHFEASRSCRASLCSF